MKRFGFILAGLFPLLALLLLGLGALIPGCNLGGSGGPASGCNLIGADVSPLVGLGTYAFVISFLTVPLGGLIALIGSIVRNKK